MHHGPISFSFDIVNCKYSTLLTISMLYSSSTNVSYHNMTLRGAWQGPISIILPNCRQNRRSRSWVLLRLRMDTSLVAILCLFECLESLPNGSSHSIDNQVNYRNRVRVRRMMLCPYGALAAPTSGSSHSIDNQVNYRNRPLPGVPKGHFIILIGYVIVLNWYTTNTNYVLCLQYHR